MAELKTRNENIIKTKHLWWALRPLFLCFRLLFAPRMSLRASRLAGALLFLSLSSSCRAEALARGEQEEDERKPCAQRHARPWGRWGRNSFLISLFPSSPAPQGRPTSLPSLQRTISFLLPVPLLIVRERRAPRGAGCWKGYDCKGVSRRANLQEQLFSFIM